MRRARACELDEARGGKIKNGAEEFIPGERGEEIKNGN